MTLITFATITCKQHSKESKHLLKCLMEVHQQTRGIVIMLDWAIKFKEAGPKQELRLAHLMQLLV